MRSLMPVIVTLCVGLLLSPMVRFAPLPASAEPTSAAPSELGALKDELAHIKRTLDGLKRELEQLRQGLSPRAAQPTRPADAMTTVGLAGNAMLGNPEAPLTLIEFSGCRVREAELLPPPALRTGRESFPSSGSSISKAV